MVRTIRLCCLRMTRCQIPSCGSVPVPFRSLLLDVADANVELNSLSNLSHLDVQLLGTSTSA